MNKIEYIIDWLKANWLLTLLGVVGFLFFIPSPSDLIATVFIIFVLEHLALILYERILLFVMNNNNLKQYFTGKDGVFSKNETLGLSIFQTGAIISAHLMVIGGAMAIYFAV